MTAPTVDRVGNIRGLLDEAKSTLCIGWDSCEHQMDPTKVLSALASIECALNELEILELNEEKARLQAQLAQVQTDEASDVRASEDVVGLARAMQQKRHGGPQ